MSFTFGQQAANSSTSPFGGGASTSNASANPKPLFGGGGFSTPNPQQQSGGNQFGNPLPAPAAPSTFSFGGASSSQPANNANVTGAAGGSGLFGNMGGQQQNQQTSSNPFGNAQQKPPGSLFGATSQQQGGGLFGSTTQNQQPQQTSSLFGSSNQPAQASSLFGATQSGQPQQSGLFGSTTQNNQSGQQGQGSLLSFGQPQQNQQPQSGQTGNLFGSIGASSTQQQPLQSSLFASASGSQPVLGSSVAPAQRQEVGIDERMMAVQRAWDSNNPECRFKYFFYNVVDPAQVGNYGRPGGATDETRWVKALRENPDPSCMVPVLAIGWADVKKRIQLQEQVASVHQQKAKEVSQALDQLSRQNTLTTSIRLAALQSSLARLQHRLIHLAAQSPAFIPALQSSSFRPDEAETKRVLEAVKSEVDGKKGTVGKSSVGLSNGLGTPNRSGAGVKMMGQVNELWGLIEELRRQRGRRSAVEKEGWLSDERALNEISEILSSQQIALQKLSELSNNAVFDAEVMRQGLGLISSNER